MKKMFFVFSIIFLLTGCHQQKNAVYYIHHPDQLKTTLENCEMMGSLANNDPTCVKAEEIYQQLHALATEYFANQQQFGQQILENQIRLGQLKNQINKIQDPLLIKQYTDLQNQTETMIALVGQALSS